MLVLLPEVELVFPEFSDEFRKKKVVVVLGFAVRMKKRCDSHPFLGEESAEHEVPSDRLLGIV